MKNNLDYDINENGDTAPASADMEDSATEIAKDKFLEQWNAIDDTNDSYQDLLGEGRIRDNIHKRRNKVK